MAGMANMLFDVLIRLRLGLQSSIQHHTTSSQSVAISFGSA